MQRLGIQLKTILLAISLAVGVPAIALAQSSGGGITGEASAGQTVTIEGADSGFHREIQIKKDGRYKLRRVPTGNYTVVVTDKDGNVTMSRSIRVVVGSTARVQ